MNYTTRVLKRPFALDGVNGLVLEQKKLCRNDTTVQCSQEAGIICHPASSPQQILQLDVAEGNENGLLGLAVGPDAKLYLIFGDRNLPDAARDPAQLPGTVLRYNLDGSVPADNPFPDSPIYAYGIRNGFGLTWHPTLDLLYETENGVGCDDELNLILPGVDYGWGCIVTMIALTRTIQENH